MAKTTAGVRIRAELLKRVKLAALLANMSMTDYISAAVEAQMAKEKTQ